MQTNNTKAVTRVEPTNWQQRLLELREEEWEAHEECLEAARNGLRRYKKDPGQRMTLTEISKLLDLSSKLGRLATAASACEDQMFGDDPEFLARLRRELDEVFGEPPIEIAVEKLPNAS